MLKALPANKLRISTDIKHIPCENSESISSSVDEVLQPRAFKAMELALRIDKNGYNVYLSGTSYLGRSYLVREFLTQHTKSAPIPPDLLYLYNFTDVDKPVLVQVPAGQGRVFKKELQEVLGKIRKEFPNHFESDYYIQGRAKILDAFQEAKSAILQEMNVIAKAQNFSLDIDDNGGVALYPMEGEKRLSEEDFDQLDTEIRQSFKAQADKLMNSMNIHVRRIGRIEQELRDSEKELERNVAVQLLDKILKPAQENFLSRYDNLTLKNYLEELYQDILDNIDAFMVRETASAHGNDLAMQGGGAGSSENPFMGRYEVNVFVDNGATKAAPIIFEEHPTAVNVHGCIERESEMGVLITDFSLIKAGSNHKANGGYLVIRIEDILQYYQSWEGLLRALRTGLARIEDIGEGAESATRTKGIEPEPVKLNLKVFLIGSEAIYETLLNGDERFAKLFRIKAHLSEQAERNEKNIKHYLYHIHNIIQNEKLLTFNKDALAWVLDYGSCLTEDQRRLSLKFPILREIMIEASALALSQNKEHVSAETLENALEDKRYRANLVEDIFMEEYDREMIKVRTSGSGIGQVNGLSVTWHGDFEFGLPHQISCTVGVGHGGIIDLEREAELGGPIHTKAMMILKSYLVSLFARKRPIVLTGSLCFEQSYAGIEGDSASGAELVALLSAIAEVPIRLDLAMTGALSQTGQIMAVGGVTRKIEGFFNVCARHGLTGTQGVIIPHDNVEHLMLSPRTIDAIKQGQFAVYAVKHIDEALALLTNLPTGKRLKNDTFTANTLYDLVDKRLQALGIAAGKIAKKGQKA